MVRLMEKPKILVGNEWVGKENTAGQAKSAADSLASTTYEKLFKLIVANLNDILWTNSQRRNFVGILDISGFENLAQNSFEQMTINLINEKIQQVLQDRVIKSKVCSSRWSRFAVLETIRVCRPKKPKSHCI